MTTWQTIKKRMLTIDRTKTTKTSCQKLFQAISAPAVLSGVGNSIIVASQSSLSFVIMALLTGWTAKNEMASIEASLLARIIKPEIAPTDQQGLGYFIQRKLSSRGLCSELQGWTYCATAISGVAQGQPCLTASFILFAVGSWAGAALANNDAPIAQSSLILPERVAKAAWEIIPHPLRIVLSDPAASFALGNVPIFGQALVTAFSTNPLTTSQPVLFLGTLVGGVITLTAAVLALRPLLSVEPPKASGWPSLVNGLGTVIMGSTLIASAVLTGQVAGLYTGTAALFLGLANFGFAHRIEKAKASAIENKSSFG